MLVRFFVVCIKVFSRLVLKLKKDIFLMRKLVNYCDLVTLKNCLLQLFSIKIIVLYFELGIHM